MKKHLIAAAVAAAVAVPAMAQNVSIYGVLDASYGVNETKGSATATSNVKSTGLADSANSSSRLGFRGTEDLGGGLKAGFVLESGLNLTNGTAIDKTNGHKVTGTGEGSTSTTSADSAVFGAATRQAFMTLSGNFGQALIGYKKTLDTDFNDTYSLLTDNSAGYEGHKVSRLTRANQIAYTTPSFSGIAASVAYSASKASYEAAATDAVEFYDVSMAQANINYVAGPLSVGVHFGSGDIDSGTGVSKSEGVSLFGVETGPGKYRYDTAAIGASYDFKVAKVTGLIGQRKIGLTGAESKSSYTEFGVAVPVTSAFTVKAGYSSAKTEPSAGGAASFDRPGFQVIADYAFSKRTSAWALYGSDKDESPATDDIKRTTARVGLTHSF
ncbi:porin [beta proteobacterium MWH-UniP1]